MEDSNKRAKGIRVNTLCNAEISEGNQLYKFVKVFMGKAPQVGKDVDLSDYYGNVYSVFVEDRKKVRKGEDELRQHVTKIKKRKKKKATYE